MEVIPPAEARQLRRATIGGVVFIVLWLAVAIAMLIGVLFLAFGGIGVALDGISKA